MEPPAQQPETDQPEEEEVRVAEQQVEEHLQPEEAQQEEQQPEASGRQRHKGTVKWFNATKGFGFISAEGQEDLFVHQTSIAAEGFRSLREGEEVEFEIEAGEDGRTKAVNVTGPQGAAPQGALRRSYRGGIAGGGTSPAYRGGGGGRGRGPPMPGAYGYPPPPPGAYGYPGPEFYAAYAYGYYPRGAAMPGGRGRGPRGGGRGGGGRGMFLQGVPGGTPGESSGLQVVVHNLPWSTTWQQLKDHFKEWKVERADVVYDSWGKSRGFGTVRFASKEDAEAACNKLNNTELEGRTITVRLDRFA